MRTSKVILYDEPTVPEIQLQRLEKFIADTFHIKTEIRKNFFENSRKCIFENIAKTRIFDLKKPFEEHVPSVEEIHLEEQNTDTAQNEEMVLYDGFEFCNAVNEFIPHDENNRETLHVIFTNKLTCTFDESDFRYHARALIGANPAIISTTGIVEAPAKPKQYYLDLMANFSREEIENVNKKYKGEFLEYHDIRISEIIEGYLLQAIMYVETGEAFCEQKECRLFNAHWQKDLFFSQLENKKFCKKHEDVFQKIRHQ